MLGQQVIGLAGFFVALPMIALRIVRVQLAASGFLFALFLVLVAVLSITGSSLLVRRAHDLGWPAALSLAAMLVPMAFVTALFVRFGATEGAKAWLELATSAPLMIAVFVFAGFLSFWLMFKKGQPEANQYGAATE